MNWLCFQIGRREYYSIPRALRRNGQQVRLLTDFWLSPKMGQTVRKLIPRSLSDRSTPEDVGEVASFNASALMHELGARFQGGDVFTRALRRNGWFNRRTKARLRKDAGNPEIVFSYSYAAGTAIDFARSRKIPMILGQIDGGLFEEEYLSVAAQRPRKAPAWYWENWKREVAAADAVVVNSPWSAECLARSGCEAKRVEIIPLAYEAPATIGSRTAIPAQFTAARPLRVLFLGQLVARKGLDVLLAAVQDNAVRGAPTWFDFVGHGEERYIRKIERLGNARHHGHAGAQSVKNFYEQADVFILPTHSDGFAITQLEAQAYGLPVITSRYCGQVVESGRNGILLAEVSADAINKALNQLLRHPEKLVELQRNSKLGLQYSLQSIGRQYVSLAEQLLAGR